MNENRRGVPRRHLAIDLGVYDADTGDQLGDLVDIHPNGLMITGEHHLEPGARRRLQVRLPQPVNGQHRFEFAATVAWSGNDVYPGVYDTGFRDLRVDPLQREKLEVLIEQFGMGAQEQE